MKRALVLLLAIGCAGGLGLAQATLTGSWDFTFKVDWWAERPWTYWKFWDLSSTLTINYVLDNWTFGSESSFGKLGEGVYSGFTSQKFTAVGALGPVNADITMTFLPMALRDKRWWFDEDVQTFSTPIHCHDVVHYEEGYGGPYFKDLKAIFSLSLAGLEGEVLFFLNGYDYYTETQWAIVEAIQTTPTVVYAQDGYLTTVSYKPRGAGWRIKLASELAGGMKITSYTYFNLLEYDAQAFNYGDCPVLGKSGVYKLADETCDGGFYEEYLMVEGISLCCGMTMDVALKLQCALEPSYTFVCDDTTGEWYYQEPTTPPDFFGFAEFLVHDIPFLPWLTLTVDVKLTTADKSLSICGEVPTLGDCLTFNVGIQWEEEDSHNAIPNKIGGIFIKDMSFVCELSECLTVSVNEVFWKLTDFDRELWLTKVEDEDYMVFLLDLGKYCFDPDVQGYSWDPEKDAWIPTSSPDDNEEYLVVCLPEFYLFGWESVELEICGPGCCGGTYEVDITTYFGKAYKTTGVQAIKKKYDPEEGSWSFVYTPVLEEVNMNTLFDWLKTEVSAAIPLSDNFTLSFGMAVGVVDVSEEELTLPGGTTSYEYHTWIGWDYLEVGISFSW